MKIKGDSDFHDMQIHTLDKACARCKYYRQIQGLVSGKCTLRLDTETDTLIHVYAFDTCDKHTK